MLILWIRPMPNCFPTSRPFHFWLAVFASLSLVSASTFRTDCILPTVTTNVVLGPNVRGTWEILWSCLFTLVLCCWSIQHPNIPRHTKTPNGYWRWALWTICESWPKVKWMLLTFLLPEFLLGKALQDRRMAKLSIERMRATNSNPHFEWTMTHGFYADMGGFALKTPSSDTLIVLNSVSLAYVCSEPNLIKEFPPITEYDINDKSKEDTLVKVITGAQLFWFLLQILTRAGYNRTISPLEFATLAYAICTVATLSLCLSKPKDVKTRTLLEGHQPSAGQQLDQKHRLKIAELRPYSWFNISSLLGSVPTPAQLDASNADPIPNDALYLSDAAALSFPRSIHTQMDDGFTLAGVIFGGLHCAAWNIEFPTFAERTLWLIASIVTTIAMPLFFALLLLNERLRRRNKPVTQEPVYILGAMTLLAYGLARIYLLVEMFRSLFFLPPSAFVNTWTSYAPHFA